MIMVTSRLIIFLDINERFILMKIQLFATFVFALLSMNSFALHSNGTVYADVNGLVCDFCARAIGKVFKKEKAVESIDVNLDDKVITIHFSEGQVLEDEKIIKLINDSGYDVVRLRYGGE